MKREEDSQGAFARAYTPLAVGPLTLRNRFIKAATNEGMAKRGIVSKGLAKFHADVAAGGAALTTVAYCATSKDGRTFVDQVTMDEDSLADLRALTDSVHKAGGAASAQITHAGSFTFLDKATLKTNKPLSSSGGFNKVGVMSGRYFKQKMDAHQIEAMTVEFVEAAKRARAAGFDAIELHMGHGYLLSQFISKLYNKRRDRFGGTIEKRLEFPSQVLRRVLDAVGKDIAVIVKYSMTDGPKGNTIEDGIAIARQIEADGAHMAVLSNGMNVESITAMFGSSLPKKGARPEGLLMKAAMKVQAMMEPPEVKFRENYLRELALQVRSAVNMPLAYLGGVQSRDGVEQAMADGFDAIALGRALIFDPAFVSRLESGKVTSSGCTACNQCVTMMYTPGGTQCAITPEKPDPELNRIGAAQ